MYSSPIYNNVEACIYKASKSFGAKDTSGITTMVGSSSSNSYELAKVVQYKRYYKHEKYGDVVSFKTRVDNIIVKEVLFYANGHLAGKYIKTRSALTRMKGLN